MNTAPAAHHPQGPSKFTAWARCAKWEGEKDIEEADIEALLPASKQADTEHKDRGTAQHGALAKVLLKVPLPFEGLSEPETEQVQWAAEQVVEIAGRAGYDTGEIAVESRLNYFGPEGSFEPLTFGTADVEFAHIVIDAKFGDMHDYFPQMAVYALMKMQRDGLERVEAIIVFARNKRVVRYVIPRQTAETVFYGILNRRNSPHARPNPCEFCGWCARKATCEAINVVVDGVLERREDWGFRLPTAKLTEAASNPAMSGAMRYLWKGFIEPWGEALDYQANLMAAVGNVPLGFRRQDERGRLVFAEAGKVVEAMKEAGVPPEAVLGAATFTMEGLAKAYAAARGGSVEKAKPVVEELLTKAGAAARGAPSFKLIRKKDAEDDIRAALANEALPQ